MRKIPKEFAPFVKDAVARGLVTVEDGARHLGKFLAAQPDRRQARRINAMAAVH